MAVDGYEVYFKMRSVWRSSIPKRLQGVDPRKLIAMLRLAASEGGISQGAAASRLDLRRWGLSKIKKKLVREGWVTVQRSQTNHREKVMTTTPRAQLAMNILEAKLAVAMTAAAGRGARPKAGTTADALKRQYGDRSLLAAMNENQQT